MKINEFLEKYITMEYETWESVHNVQDAVEVDRIINEFERKFFAEDVFSNISQPGGLDNEEFREFSALISAKRKRKVICVNEVSSHIYLSVLGSIYDDGEDGFELVYISIDPAMKIVSQYLTNFDGSYSHVGGENFGDIIEDPCL